MYAIINVSGRQEKVEKNGQFTVNRMDGKEGSHVKLSQVMFVKKNNETHIGTPYVKGAHVECDLVSHVRGEKVIAFKYRRRKGYHRKVGHRQDLTLLRVKEIHV